MDFKTIIGLMAASLLIFKKQEDSLASIKDKLEQLEDDQRTDVEDINNRINNMDSTSDEYVKKYIRITPFLQFTRVANKNWIGRFTWEIKNTSSNKTFTITAVKASFSLCGYACKLFIPGNDDQPVVLYPGQKVRLNSTWQDKRWYDDSHARDVIRESLRKDIGKSVGGKLFANISVKVQSALAGAGVITANWENVAGDVWLTSGAVHYYNNQGENFINRGW